MASHKGHQPKEKSVNGFLLALFLAAGLILGASALGLIDVRVDPHHLRGTAASVHDNSPAPNDEAANRDDSPARRALREIRVKDRDEP